MSSKPRSSIQTVIIDSQVTMRAALKSLLETQSNCRVIGELTFADVSTWNELTLPDIVLVHYSGSESVGTEQFQEIRDAFPSARIVVLCQTVSAGQVRQALQIGVTSYLLTTAAPLDFAAAIQAAYLGKPTLSPEVTQAVIKSATKPETVALLTHREREILKYIVKGNANSEIASILGVSPATIKNHLNNIFTKLQVTNRTEAAMYALHHNLG
ncbi:MAG: response regulator transcription factor [Anaerolineae bacterium]|nr:response regulator transcription factor [Anaerolineae bacterium]